MTVHDFIVIYNDTFKFIYKKYGPEALRDLWATISLQWCTHLRELVKAKGLEGMKEYWGGNDGTLGREKAVYNITLKDEVFQGRMFECPSIGELKERGRDVFNEGLTYCDHCRFLYCPVVEDYSFSMSWFIDYDESGRCTGKCRWSSKKRSN